VDVDPANVAMAQGWDGPTGDLWVEHADLFDAGVARYTEPFLAAAAIDPGTRVLDVGCGTGQTTRDAARLSGTGAVTGVDLSARMLDLARRRAAGLPNVRFVQADAQVADLGEHDRVISRTGVMFFGNPVAAFTNLACALVPGGRLALAVWAPYAEQEWISSFRTAAAGGRAVPPPPPEGPHPFSLGDPDRVRALLGAAGFTGVGIEGVREPMWFGPDVATAERMVLGIVGATIDELDEPARAAARGALRESLASHLGPDGVSYRSAMLMVTAGR
jgi:SAM-dependent methyltransferase